MSSTAFVGRSFNAAILIACLLVAALDAGFPYSMIYPGYKAIFTLLSLGHYLGADGTIDAFPFHRLTWTLLSTAFVMIYLFLKYAPRLFSGSEG